MLAFAQPTEKALKGHRSGASYLAKAPSRWMLECVMEKPLKPSRKRTSVLEVQVMFEPTRLAQQCLQDAYACLIPTMHHCLGQSYSSLKSAQACAERNAQ